MLHSPGPSRAVHWRASAKGITWSGTKPATEFKYSSPMDHRTRAAITLLWVGAFLPIAATVSKTTEEVTSGVGVLEIIRGGGPLALFFTSLLVAPYQGEKHKISRTEIFLGTFLAIAFSSTLWSYNPMATALKCIPLIFMYLCLWRISRLYQSPVAAIGGMVTVAHVLMISTLVQWVVIPGQTYTADVGDVIPRLGSLYPAISPNLLGVVALVALAGAVLQVGPKVTHSAIATLLLGIVYVLMLFASRSRIATAVALSVVLVSALLAMHKTPFRVAVGWFSAAAALLVGYVATLQTTIMEDFTQFLIRGQDSHALTSLTGRTVIWDSALAIWGENPGVGYGYYAGHRLFLPSMDPLFRRYSNLDSTWIETLVNLGYVGFIPLVLFASAAFVRVVRAPLPRAERIIAVGLVTATLTLSFVNPTIQTASSTAILFGVVVFACRPTKTPAIEREFHPRQPRIEFKTY